jgi:hypothetical protein
LQNHSHCWLSYPRLAASVQLHRNPHGRLVLTLPDGTAHEGVVPVRAFPSRRPRKAFRSWAQMGMSCCG